MIPISLPQFSTIDTGHYAERLDALLANNLKKIEALLCTNTSFNWTNLMQPLEVMEDELARFWSPFSHVHAVLSGPAVRACYEACLPKLSSYQTKIGHNKALFDAIQSIDTSPLDRAQQKIIADTLQGFELSGVALSPEHKKRFETITSRLSALANQFQNNVLDAVSAYQLPITDAKRLHGLPPHAVDTARLLAEKKGLPGWVLSLETPCYLAVITYAEDRSLREELYYAYVTRASDQGPNAGQFDNTQIMHETLALRHEEAQLLGFSNYAELSLATKMAESTEEVIDFLLNLSQRVHQQAQEEFNQLQTFAQSQGHEGPLAPWDIAYWSEKKKEANFSISEEALRPYFPLNQVMKGLFEIINRLYGMTLEPVNDVDTWHTDARCYRVLDESNELRAFIYMDLFARPHKRGGAWMNTCQSRYKRVDGSIQLPIATVTCNFAKTSSDEQPLLSHSEVETLFHEFGHCLHHTLTQVDYLDASGIQGVEWDAVELPSQFFENWCWQQRALELLTAHVDTGDSLPVELFNQLFAAKNFQSAMGMLRQLELSLFDFRIHQEFNSQQPALISDVLQSVRNKISVIPVVDYNRFQHSFTHVFSGGYAAGYYSYKWAEVLSSDAFARFEEEGVFNPKTGRDFLHCILEVGGSCKAEEAYLKFRGRKASVDALLKQNGIPL